MSANTSVSIKLDNCGRAYSESTDDNYHGRACWPPGPKILPGTNYVSRLEDPSIMALANRVFLDSEHDLSLQTAQAMCSLDANKAHCDDLNIFVRMRPGLTFEIPTRENVWKMRDTAKWSHAQFQKHVEWQRYMRQFKPDATDAPPQPAATADARPDTAAPRPTEAAPQPAATPATSAPPAPPSCPALASDDSEFSGIADHEICKEYSDPLTEWLCFTGRIAKKLRQLIKGRKTVPPASTATSASAATAPAAAASTSTSTPAAATAA